jgi:hypothetical protein
MDRFEVRNMIDECFKNDDKYKLLIISHEYDVLL